MARREHHEIMQSIRDAVAEQRYVATSHALIEMRADGLDVADAESAILTGRIVRVLDDDPRGPRFEVVGSACDLSTPVCVVLRDAGVWLIITVYELKG